MKAPEPTANDKLDLIIAILRGGCTCVPIGTNIQGSGENATCTKCGRKAIQNPQLEAL